MPQLTITYRHKFNGDRIAVVYRNGERKTYTGISFNSWQRLSKIAHKMASSQYPYRVYYNNSDVSIECVV